jgi:hypothetical protein
VYRTADAARPVFIVDAKTDDMPPDFIYTKGDEIFLVSYAGTKGAKNVRVFTPMAEGFRQVRETAVPGWIRDVDPTSGVLLISRSRDMPLLGYLYLYDEHDGRESAVGYSANTIAMFLPFDFLTKRFGR